MSRVVPTLRRFDRLGWELWLVPALVGAALATILRASGSDIALARGLVFVGGPLLLLAGLHARLGGYLHADTRHRLLARPIAPIDHWRAARPNHWRGLLLTAGIGVIAIAIGTVGGALSGVAVAGLLADWGWQWLMAAGLEPAIPAAGAWMGRRFAADRFEHEWQQRLGGGWTIPEAVVHLYAPAMGVGLATALAMPGQLWLDRSLEGLSAPPALATIGVLGLPIAVLIGRLSRRGYQRGMFGAVPWVHEAMRTLAGPPVPEAVPSWVLWGRDPLRHLWLRQFWRSTPVPGLRLVALVGGATWMAVAAPVTVPIATIGVGLVAAWLVPALRLRALRSVRGRICATLPLPARDRSGHSWSAWVTICSPVVVSVLVVIVSWSSRT